MRKDLYDRVDTDSSQLVPVEIVPAAAMPPAVEVSAPSASPGRRRRKSGIIEIELGGGHRVRVDRDGMPRRCGACWTRSGPDDSGSERRAGVAATGHTDMRKGFPGLALVVQETLKRDPHTGHLFVFRAREDASYVLTVEDGGLGSISKPFGTNRRGCAWSKASPGNFREPSR